LFAVAVFIYAIGTTVGAFLSGTSSDLCVKIICNWGSSQIAKDCTGVAITKAQAFGDLLALRLATLRVIADAIVRADPITMA